MGHVNIGRGPGAAHVEHIRAALRTDHAEVHEKGLHLVQVGNLQARERHIANPDDRLSAHVPSLSAKPLNAVR